MQKAERLALATVRGVLEPDGFQVALMPSARHPHLVVHAPDGWSRSFTIACSARADDQCQVNYARQKANALLREFRARPRPDPRPASDPRAGAGPRQPAHDAPEAPRAERTQPPRPSDRQRRR